MGLQTIINKADSIEIDRRKLVGVQYTRNEIARVSETPSYNPWRINMTIAGGYRYSEARQIIEALDSLDRRTPQQISFANNQGMGWLFAYQGQLSVQQRAQVTFQSFSARNLVLNVSAVTGANSGTVILAQGDFIQIKGYPYPFTSTSTVLKGSGSTVTVTTHRPNILTTTPSAGTQFNWGNDVIFNMFCPNMPVYKLVPGGYSALGNTVLNNARIEWSDQFKLYEWVAGA